MLNVLVESREMRGRHVEAFDDPKPSAIPTTTTDVKNYRAKVLKNGGCGGGGRHRVAGNCLQGHRRYLYPSGVGCPKTTRHTPLPPDESRRVGVSAEKVARWHGEKGKLGKQDLEQPERDSVLYRLAEICTSFMRDKGGLVGDLARQ